MEQIGKINNTWAFHIIDQLVQQKVSYFCIAPGSRSSPLALAIAKNVSAKYTIHFDERALGFYALGYNSSKIDLCALVVTSGTAVGNLLPSIMEAKESGVPLLILSADRPMNLHSSGANQTSDQIKIFQNFVTWQHILQPNRHVDPIYIQSVISYAVIKMRQDKAPVHINCMFEEPLFSLKEEKYLPIPTKKYHFLQHISSSSHIEKLFSEYVDTEYGLIIVGKISDKVQKVLLHLAHILQWPIYIEVLSRREIEYSTYPVLKHLSHIIEYAPSLLEKISCILQFGEKIISSPYQKWIKKHPKNRYVHISENLSHTHSMHHVTDQLVMNLFSLSSIILSISAREKSSWLCSLTSFDRYIEKVLEEQTHNYPHLTSSFFFRNLSAQCDIFLGNSTAIRDANSHFFPKNCPFSFFSNRGVSGIDGNIATCFGLSKALESPLDAIMGDLTFMHDLSSLHFAKKHPYFLNIFVINNQGGGIFSTLRTRAKEPYFSEFFLTPHEYSLHQIAQFFDCKYTLISSKEELVIFFQKHKCNQTQVVELKILNVHNQQLTQLCTESLKKNLCSTVKNMEKNLRKHGCFSMDF